MTNAYRGRFAPSPSGRLHFGSLVAALGSWLLARRAGGRWIVRMEDVDLQREAPGAAADILHTLHAFGLDSDEPVMFQSLRRDAHLALREHLAGAGLAYRCWCSRSDLEASGGRHPRTCIAAEQSRPPSWRLRVPAGHIAFDDAVQGRRTQDVAADVGDFVIWRADDSAAYHLAVVADDAAQAITEVVRGADLLDSTPRQVLLQRMLGLPTPRYAHLPLVVDGGGRKLSKHEAALPVEPTDPLPALRHALAFLGQAVPAADSPAALLDAAARAFDARRIPRTPRAFAAMQKDRG